MDSDKTVFTFSILTLSPYQTCPKIAIKITKNCNRRPAFERLVGKLLGWGWGGALHQFYSRETPFLILMQFLITNTVDSRYLDLAYLE